ncbi:MAG: ATP synthase F1 subunit gamma [Patescibacteria group bacterium]|nr:ATP synthase F1 subunit gamma [Patescibacteria group bacterium]
MAVSTRLIRRRIKSVANTRKITKAMELVAAAKMRKAVQLTLASREYAKTIIGVVKDVSPLVDPMTHPLLAGRREAKRSLLIIAAADRGLCGSFNSLLIKKTLEFLKTRKEPIDVITVGKKAEGVLKRAGFRIFAAFEAISNAPSFERSQPVGELAYKEFMSGNIDRVFLAYTDFKNAVIQIPKVEQLLPVIPENELPLTVSKHDEDEMTEKSEPKAIFEPDAEALLNNLLPRLLEMQVYQSLLESAASEHSSRTAAMHSATDNATGMLDDLTLTFNQARQASITREISEISAGKAAIE